MFPNGTWYGVNVLDSSGQVIDGHENMSLPLSLAVSTETYIIPAFMLVLLGTENEYYTPIVKALSVGATRYLGDSNGWSIPSGVTRLANGTWENPLWVRQ